MNARPCAPTGLADALRRRTQALHARAERSGVFADLLRGRGSREGYALLMRNLLPAYECMERELERRRGAPGAGALALPCLYRSARLAADLAALGGPGWRAALALLPAGQRYADAVAASAAGGGERLLAHAYVRYLGDLSGGQLLKPLLSRSLGLDGRALTFYDFPEIGDVARFKAELRRSIDAAGERLADAQAVLAEAETAFRLNVEVSESVQARLAGG